MQTDKKIFDDMSRLAAGAASLMSGAGKEAQSAFKAFSERTARELDLVSREDFEVVRDMAIKAREENEALRAELEALKKELAPKPRARKAPAKKAPVKKPAAKKTTG